MPVATEGIYEVKLNLDRAGEELVNIFHYRETGGSDTGAADLAADFVSTFETPLQTIFSTAVNIVSVTVRPIFGTGVEITESFTPGTTGDLAGETMPIYSAVSLRYERDSREIRSGWKRFGPMTEAEVVGDFFTAGYITIVETLATALEAQLTNVSGIFDPVIFRPANSAIDPLPRWVGIINISTINRVTTQNSRKRF